MIYLIEVDIENQKEIEVESKNLFARLLLQIYISTIVFKSKRKKPLVVQ